MKPLTLEQVRAKTIVAQQKVIHLGYSLGYWTEQADIWTHRLETMEAESVGKMMEDAGLTEIVGGGE